MSFSCFKPVFAVILAIVLMLPGIARAGKTDSLKRILTSTISDTARSRILSQLAYDYQDVNLDTAITFANQGLRLAEKTGYERGKGDCLQQLGLAAMRKNKLQQAIGYYTAAQSCFEKADHVPGQASAILSIGDITFRQGKYDTAISYYKKGRTMAQKGGDLRHEGLALMSLGGLMSDRGNYADAQKYYLDAVTIFEKSGDRQELAMTLTDIATLYSALGQHEKALNYIKKSGDLGTNGIGKEQQLFIVVNTGIVYGQMKNYTNALAYFERGARLADSIGDANWRLMCLNNIASCYSALGDKSKQIAAWGEVLKMTEKVNDAIVIVSAHSAMGKLLIETGRVKEGIDHLLQAHKMATDKKMNEGIYKTARELSAAYEKLNDLKNALRYHKLYSEFKDSVYNKESDKKIEELQYEHELGKKETQIQLLQKSRQIEQSRAAQHKTTAVALFVGLLMLAVICLLLYRNSKREKRSKELIMAQKEEIVLQAQNLEELNAFKDKTFSVLSHDLRSPISAFTTSMMLINEGFITEQQFAELRPALTSQVNSLNSLLDSLLKWGSVYMKGQAQTRPEKINLSEVVNQNISLLQYEAAKKRITIINEASADTYAICDGAQMDIVIRNLLMNGIKFTGSHGRITVAAHNDTDKTILTITDTGVGMSAHQLEQLFKHAPGSNTPGTEGETGLGLGLMLCREFIKANNGDISACSQPGQGTTFTISLPAAESGNAAKTVHLQSRKTQL